jgi:hypothetical protein
MVSDPGGSALLKWGRMASTRSGRYPFLGAKIRNGGGAGSEVTSEECRRRCKGMAPIHTCLRACTVIARYSSSEEHTTALSSLPSPPPPLLICLSLFFLLPQGTFLSAEEEEEKLLCLSRSRRTNPSALTSCCCCGPQR